jgi:integrase
MEWGIMVLEHLPLFFPAVYIASTQPQCPTPKFAAVWFPTLPKLTKRLVEKILPPDLGQVFYRDDELRGFALRVTPGSKTYIVEVRVNGKPRRVTIGKHGPYTPETARKEAQKLLGLMAQGVDPNAADPCQITVGQLFEQYKQSRKLKPSTLANYDKVVARCFPDWLPMKVTDITRDMIDRKHKALSSTPGPRGSGQAQADLAMRILRALFKYAEDRYQDAKGNSVVINPVRRVAWNNVARRQGIIRRHHLAAWFKAVLAEDEIMRDYLILILLTGLRRNEAAGLRWSFIDLRGRMLTLPSGTTKNDEEHELPLSDVLVSMLERRFAKNKRKSAFVFPGTGDEGHLVESKRAVGRVWAAMADELGLEGEQRERVRFMLHDLRRTFITIAEGLDISPFAIKRLVNHKFKSNDVTGGYIVRDTERLRIPMQRITDYIFDHAGAEKERLS